VQEGYFAALQYSRRHHAHQAPGEAASSMVGTRADAADAGKSFRFHSLPGHREQLAILFHADELA